MISFNEFIERKTLTPICESLVNANVDVNALCEAILETAKEINPRHPEAVNEIWRGLGALFGAGKQAATDAASAVKNKVVQAGQAGLDMAKQAGSAVINAADKTISTVGQAGIKAGQAVGGAVKDAAQGVADIYQSAEHQGKIKDATGRVQKLQAELEQLGWNKDFLDSLFQELISGLSQQGAELAGNKQLRVGAGGVYDSRTGAAPA